MAVTAEEKSPFQPPKPENLTAYVKRRRWIKNGASLKGQLRSQRGCQRQRGERLKGVKGEKGEKGGTLLSEQTTTTVFILNAIT